MSANPYFSQGHLKPWNVVTGTLTLKPSGGHNGTPYGELDGISAEMRNPAWLWYDTGPDVEVLMKARVRDVADLVGGSGNVKLALDVRQLNATGTSSEYDHLAGNPNISAANTVGDWVEVRSFSAILPTDGWITYNTTTYNLSDSFDGSAVRIRIVNSLTDASGDPIPLWVDNARVHAP